MATEAMTTKKRDALFREQYAAGGREPPELHKRKKSAKWDKEAKRDATHSRG